MGSKRTSLAVLLTFTVAMIASMTIVPQGALAADADPLQDFCVADLGANQTVLNGYPCISPELVTDDHFWFGNFTQAANLTGNPFNGSVTTGAVRSWPALNTQGLALARLDINPGGVILPHTHNLATEIVFCLEGEIYTGFVTNSGNPTHPNKLFSKVIKPYEAFIIPRGLLHFQINRGSVPAVAYNVLNGQNPGLQLMNIALFGSGIGADVLAKSFFMSEPEVDKLESILSQFSDAGVSPN